MKNSKLLKVSKRALIILLIIVFSIGIVACGGAENIAGSSSGSYTEDSGGTVTVNPEQPNPEQPNPEQPTLNLNSKNHKNLLLPKIHITRYTLLLLIGKTNRKFQKRIKLKLVGSTLIV